jgi:hypothetical protein
MSGSMEEEMETTPAKPREPEPPRRARRLAAKVRVGAVLAVAAAIGLVVGLVVRRNGESKPKPERSTVATLSQRGLKTLAGSLGGPIYWIGPTPGYRYELTQTNDGRIYLRYLPPGVNSGTKAALLMIGTYRVQNAFAVTRSAARKGDSVRVPIRGNGVAFYARSSPKNVYVAYPGSNYQIEVYDPTAGRARQLAVSGQVAPIAGGGAGAAKAVTFRQLKVAARVLGHPLYWVGRKRGLTYELTQTSDGRVYLRYLPRGERAGADKPFLTIGTYPVRNAFATSRRLANVKTAVRVPVAGGIAFYSRSRPTNVYVAFRGIDYQIEVYDPSAVKARRLVKSGQLVRVS